MKKNDRSRDRLHADCLPRSHEAIDPMKSDEEDRDSNEDCTEKTTKTVFT